MPLWGRGVSYPSPRNRGGVVGHFGAADVKLPGAYDKYLHARKDEGRGRTRG